MTDAEYFEKSFDRLMFNEGAYSNNPNDAGGETMWGITKKTAQGFGYFNGMKDMPLETAKKIYLIGWWNKLKYPAFENALKFQIFDAAVNHGSTNAIKILQRSLDIRDDGFLGPKTFEEIYREIDDMDRLISFFNVYRGKFFRSLKDFKNFGKGWEDRLDNNILYYYENHRKNFKRLLA